MSAADGHRGLHHRAFLYDEPGQFVRDVGAFVREGLRNGAPVLAAVTLDKAAWLRDELGGDADRVEFRDASRVYARHGPMLTEMLQVLKQHEGTDGGARIIAEQALGRRAPADVRSYMRHEAAFNVAAGRYGGNVLCPYDTGRLPDEIVLDALRTHPEVLGAGEVRRTSPAFMDPRTFVHERVRVGEIPPGAPSWPLDGFEDLVVVRRAMRSRAAALGFSPADIEDFAVAVSEIAANAVSHGEGPRRMWTYVEDRALVCRIRDAGPGLGDPLAGYLPPDPEALGGRGLWMAHHLCDIVEIASAGTGTDVCLRATIP